jgi:2-hydroxychromene-2-carboxylate isomerase
MPAKVVEYYYDFSSTNSYFATFLTPEVCRHTGAALRWMPFYLGHAFRNNNHSLDKEPRAKLAYFWRDHQRWAKRTGLPFRMPSIFPIKSSQALRGAVVMRQWEKEQAYIQEVFRAYWERDENIADPAVLGQIAVGLGVDANAFLHESQGEATRQAVIRVTDEGIKRGVFGAPTFFVGEEMFWGKDRLDFVEELLREMA